MIAQLQLILETLRDLSGGTLSDSHRDVFVHTRSYRRMGHVTGLIYRAQNKM